MEFSDLPFRVIVDSVLQFLNPHFYIEKPEDYFGIFKKHRLRSPQFIFPTNVLNDTKLINKKTVNLLLYLFDYNRKLSFRGYKHLKNISMTPDVIDQAYIENIRIDDIPLVEEFAFYYKTRLKLLTLDAPKIKTLLCGIFDEVVFRNENWKSSLKFLSIAHTQKNEETFSDATELTTLVLLDQFNSHLKFNTKSRIINLRQRKLKYLQCPNTLIGNHYEFDELEFLGVTYVNESPTLSRIIVPNLDKIYLLFNPNVSFWTSNDIFKSVQFQKLTLCTCMVKDNNIRMHSDLFFKWNDLFKPILFGIIHDLNIDFDRKLLLEFCTEQELDSIDYINDSDKLKYAFFLFLNKQKKIVFNLPHSTINALLDTYDPRDFIKKLDIIHKLGFWNIITEEFMDFWVAKFKIFKKRNINLEQWVSPLLKYLEMAKEDEKDEKDKKYKKDENDKKNKIFIQYKSYLKCMKYFVHKFVDIIIDWKKLTRVDNAISKIVDFLINFLPRLGEKDCREFLEIAISKRNTDPKYVGNVLESLIYDQKIDLGDK